MAVLRSERRKKGILTFLFIFAAVFIFLIQFADPVSSATSSSQSSPMSSPRRMLAQSRIDRVKKASHVSSSPRRRAWKTVSATPSNSSRNSRQVPEIPALYSAPKIQTPEIPALYSAPKEKDAQQNELDDQQVKATTEIAIGGDEEEDETSSEDYQYGVPTEKSPRMMSDDSNQDEEELPNEYPTDSPIPQATYLPPVSRTNDVEFDDDNENNDETTEDSNSSSGGYGNGEEPSPQYGPPQASSRKNGNGANKRKMQGSSSRGASGNSGNNRRPSDQQQIENSLQPMTRHHQENSGNNAEPKPGYLPPVYQPPTQEQQPESQRAPPQQQEQRPSKPKQQDTFSNNRYSSNGDDYGQQPPNPNYHTLPEPEEAPAQHPPEDLGQEGRLHSQPQGHYFGNSNQQGHEQPNTYYGPPRDVNHFHQQQQQPTSTGNNIVSNTNGGAGEDDELEGLNEKIVDAELLERVQQIIEDHENQQKEFLDKIQKDNENTIFSSSGRQGYDDASGGRFAGNELSSGDRNSAPYPVYGPPRTNNNNGYSNPSSGQPAGAYLPPSRDTSAKTLAPDVQVQKAVLSRHFTETEPNPTSSSAFSSNDRNSDNSGYKSSNQLNSVSGPGLEYLPPSSRNLPSSGYPNAFRSGGKPSAEAGNGGYSVKVGAGITVADNNNNAGLGSTSRGSSIPSTVYGAPSTLSYSAGTGSQVSGEFHARQEGGSSSPGVLERFPPQYQAPSQQQHQQQQQNFQPSEFWSRTSPQQTAGSASSSGRLGAKYGPPSPTLLGTGGSSNNGISSGEIKYSSGSGDSGLVNNDQPEAGAYNQRSPSHQQTTTQYLPPNTGMMIAVPRPVYGVPLAPVITLDSDNNLQNNFNKNGNSHNNSPASGSPDASSNPDPTSNYYLPPSSQNGGIGQHQPAGLFNSLNLPQQQQESPGGGTSSNANHVDDGSYGFSSSTHQSPSSSSSAYLMIQGHNGNSNNHIYSINHNGFDDTTSTSSVGSASSLGSSIFARLHELESSSIAGGGTIPSSSEVDDYGSSSIMIPGISNAFSLPIYDYSPSHQNLVHEHELLGAATSPVEFPFEQLLQHQHQLPPNILTLPENFPAAFFYNDVATRRQDNFRVSRRALSRKASISPSFNNPNQKQQPILLSTPATLPATTSSTIGIRKTSTKNPNSSNSNNGNSRKG